MTDQTAYDQLATDEQCGKWGGCILAAGHTGLHRHTPRPAEEPQDHTAASLREQYARAIRDAVRVRLGTNALRLAEEGRPVMLNMSEAEAAADAVLAVRDAARQAAGQPATEEQPLVIPRDAAEAVHAALGQLLDVPSAGLAVPTNHNTETPLAPLVTHTPGEAPPSFEEALDAIISAALHEAARRMENAGHDDDAVAFLDLLADRQTAGADTAAGAES